MTENELTEDGVYERFMVAVAAIGGQRAFAASVGLTPSYINDIVHKRRAISNDVCAALGVERIVSVRYFYVGAKPGDGMNRALKRSAKRADDTHEAAEPHQTGPER